ncbi:unnamed protein product [[Candida] boidinii]|nr:unnamed protein product [[Candida] boidinii]
MNFDEEEQNHDAQFNKSAKSNSFSTSSFLNIDDCSLEDSPFQNDTSKRKRRNSISQVTDITEFREKFQSQSKDFIRAETFYSPSPLIRLKATRSTPSLSRYHSGDEKTLRSIMKKQNLMDSYSCPNTAASKMAVSFKESVQVVNYDPLDCTTGLKNPFPISVKNSPKINSVFRASTIDRVSKTPPKFSFEEKRKDRFEYFGDPDKISFKKPNENLIAPNRNIKKLEKAEFSDGFSTESHDNKPMDKKRNFLNVVKMDSGPDNTEINMNSQNTFTPSDMKSVLCVTSGGGDSNDSAITKKKKLDAAAFYSDDSLKRLNKSDNSTNADEVCEFLQENNEETNFEPYIVPSSKEFQITNNKEFSKLNSVYAERKKLLFGEDCQSDSEDNTCIDNIIDKEEQKVQSADNIKERANKFLGKVRLNNRSRNFNRTISEIDQRLIIVNNELSDLQIELANLRQERKTLKKRRRRIVKSANKLNNRMAKNQDILYANNHKEASSNIPVRKSLRKINSVIGSVSGSLLEAASASLSRSGSVSGSKSGSPHAYILTDTTNKNFNQDGTFGSNLAEYNDSIHTINEKSRENFSIRSIVPWLNFSRHENENENEIENKKDKIT